MNPSKIVLITGATAGIGRATALYLAEVGYHVIASGRNLEELAKLRQATGRWKLDTVLLDVTSQLSISAAEARVAELTNGYGVDVLINNAGFGVMGPTAEISDADLRRQYETNVFGLMSVTRAFLPAMQRRRSGHIINLSSVGGRVTLPFYGVYNSTKYALESLSNALRYELHPFGIHVTLIEPGAIKTNFEPTAVAQLGKFARGPYAKAIAKFHAQTNLLDKLSANPSVIAKTIERAIATPRPAARYVAPAITYVALISSLALPTAVWDWAIRRAGRIDRRTVEVSTVGDRREPRPTPVATRISNEPVAGR
ncbi:MAG: SDR family oxidoreductase [Kofleriaceae bacterium]